MPDPQFMRSPDSAADAAQLSVLRLLCAGGGRFSGRLFDLTARDECEARGWLAQDGEDCALTLEGWAQLRGAGAMLSAVQTRPTEG